MDNTQNPLEKNIFQLEAFIREQANLLTQSNMRGKASIFSPEFFKKHGANIENLSKNYQNHSMEVALPAATPVTNGTAISSTWANTTLDDIETTLTASLDRSGNGGMLAALEGYDGTVGAPGYSFGNESTMGIYRIAAARMGFSVGSTKIVEVDSTGLEVTSGVFIAPSGTAALPGFSFTGDLNTGMSAQTADTLVASTGGTARLTLTSSAATFAPVLSAPVGTAAAPGYTFTGDTNTGMSAQTADTLILSVAGAAALTMTATAFTPASQVLAPDGSPSIRPLAE